MIEPIKSGDSCEVVGGALEDMASPNIGKKVIVRSLRGEHSVFGRIWQCEGHGLVTEYGGLGNVADFAQSWLLKLPPQKTVTREDISAIA